MDSAATRDKNSTIEKDKKTTRGTSITEEHSSSKYDTTKSVVSTFTSKFTPEVSVEPSRPTIVYYKQGCRKRIPKGAQNIEFKRSRPRREAFADAVAFQVHEINSAKWNANALESLRDDGSKLVRRVLDERGLDQRDVFASKHNTERNSINSNQSASSPVGTKALSNAVPPSQDSTASIKDLENQAESKDGHRTYIPRLKPSRKEGASTTICFPRQRSRNAEWYNSHRSQTSGPRDLIGANTRVVNEGGVSTTPSIISSRPRLSLKQLNQSTSPSKPIDTDLHNHRRQDKHQVQSGRMGGRPGPQGGVGFEADESVVRHSSRSTRSQADPSETSEYSEFAVLNGNTGRSRTRGFQPSEVRKSSKAPVKASECGISFERQPDDPVAISESSEVNESHKAHIANECASTAPLNATKSAKATQSSDIAKPRSVTTDKTDKYNPAARPQDSSTHKLETTHLKQIVANGSSAQPHHPLALHASRPVEGSNPSPTAPATQTTRTNRSSFAGVQSNANGASPPSSSESARLKIITYDEGKSSFWSRATGSVPGKQEPLRPRCVDSQHSVNGEPHWLDDETGAGATNEKWTSRRTSIGTLRDMPTYRSPTNRKKVSNMTKDSFERQKPYVDPASQSHKPVTPVPNPINRQQTQQHHSLEEGEILNEEAPKMEFSSHNEQSSPKALAHVPIGNDTVSTLPRNTPTYHRQQPKPVNANRSVHTSSMELDSQTLLEQMKAGIPGFLISRVARGSAKQKEPSNVEHNVKSEQSKLSAPDMQAAEMTPQDTNIPSDQPASHQKINVQQSSILTDGKSSPDNDNLSSALPHRKMPRNPVVAEATKASNHGDKDEEQSEPHHLGSGIVNVSEEPPKTPKKADKFSSSNCKSRSSKGSDKRSTPSKKGYHSDIPVTKYEPQLVDWEGKWMSAPVGEEWNKREQYHRLNERQSALKFYAEDHAVDPDHPTEIVDINSPSFRAGRAIQDEEGIDEVDLSKTNGLRFDPTTPNTIVEKANKTTADMINGYTPKPESPDPFDKFGIASMTKDQKRRRRQEILEMEKQAILPSSAYTPKANIYLRPVESKDTQQITAIWNFYVRTSVANPITEPDQTTYWHEEIAEANENKEPFVVAVLLGDKSSRDFNKVKRLKQEHLVGFGRATIFGTRHSIYRDTIDIELYVQDGHLGNGIGKTMLDRLLAATVLEYQLKEGSKFISPDAAAWSGGSFRPAKTILFSLLHHEGDKDLEWKKKWIESYEFVFCGLVPNIGFKFGKPVHQTQYYYHTNKTLYG